MASLSPNLGSSCMTSFFRFQIPTSELEGINKLVSDLEFHLQFANSRVDRLRLNMPFYLKILKIPQVKCNQ